MERTFSKEPIMRGYSCGVAAAVTVMALAAYGAKVDFALWDSHGRKVSSQDYAGVPIFLEFGPCW